MKPNKNCKTCQRVADAAQAQAAASVEEKRAARAELDEDSGKPTFNCSPMLKDQILKASYFKSLLNITSVEALAEEIIQYCDGLDIYQVGSATNPSPFLCAVFRLFTLEPREDEVQLLLDHASSANARCVACLYVRFVVKPERLWDRLEEYMFDDMDLGDSRISGGASTIGEYVESLLMKEKYFGTPLPRLPVKVRLRLEERVAPLMQYRKRTQANRRVLKRFREVGTRVEVCRDDGWHRGEVIEYSTRSLPSRPKIAVRLADGDEILVHLGKVILSGAAARGDAGGGSDDEAAEAAEGRPGAARRGRRSRSRSRSGRRRNRAESPDWTREKGKSDADMVKALRERLKEEAVCNGGKDYAKRPMGFEAGLAIRREQGSQESRLIEEETYSERRPTATRRRGHEEGDDDDDLLSSRRSGEEQERQRKLAQIYEKYGQQVSASASRVSDVDRPDVMRLG